MFEPLNQGRPFELVVRQIREAIYTGKLKQGDKLATEMEMAAQFAVSRAAIRSAVLSLEQSGLLEIRKGPKGGFFIRELDFKSIRDSLNDLIQLGHASISDLTEARSIIEPNTMALAARRSTAEDLDKLTESIRTFKDRVAEGFPPEPADLQFHICIAEAAQNPVIIMMMRSLMDLLYKNIGSYFLTPKPGKLTGAQHQEILEAIKAGDSQRARKTMFSHLEAMRDLFKAFEAGNGQVEPSQKTDKYP
jgi:GntR family transcriptional repressor for pyruvate dehydrogenase complex